MHVITSVGGLLRTLPGLGHLPGRAGGGSRKLVTGLSALDEMLPEGAFVRGAVHEVLNGVGGVKSQAARMPFLLPALLARSAIQSESRVGMIVWCDFDRDLYPPALLALGIPMERLLVLRPATMAEGLWAVTECLRCRGVAACITPAGRLTRVQARRLQLAAERGGGIGVLLRPAEAVAWPYAAATRWKVTPARGERMLQRVSVELIHGHGGRVGKNVLLEVCRETNHVRAVEPMAHRPGQPKTATG